MWRSSAFALLAWASLSEAQFGIKHTQYGTSEPVYPSPKISGAGGWEAALAKAKGFVAELTPEEKANMVTGTRGPCVGNIAPVPRLNFTGLCLQDGPAALRQAVYASVFPAGVSAASSWDKDLIYQHGALMAQEFRDKGSHVILGPVIGALGRSPYAGRNWEGFSPDSYLSGVLVEETVKGMQSVGVQACTKHFIGNEQEEQRNPTTVDGKTVEAISSNMDDRTMHETYLWPFYNAVRAGTTSIMCSYQRLNGSYGCQNSKAINGLLKTELGFQGYVISDWKATRSGVPAIEAGLDMNMPGPIEFLGPTDNSYFGENITIAVNNGSLSTQRVDDMIERIMAPYFALGQDKDYPPVDGSTVPLSFYTRDSWVHDFPLGPLVDARRNHHEHIRELGAAGSVLLKNEKGVLPLKKPMNIGVFGNDAADFSQGNYNAGAFAGGGGGDYDIGTLPLGGGSGTGRYTYVVSPLEAIKTRGHSYGALVQYVTSNWAISNGALANIAPVPEVCLLFLKSWATEEKDRVSLEAQWNSTVVVEKTAAYCNNTVVVVHGGAPVVMPWRNNPNVTAILAAHMPGQETGNSLVDLLWGDANPSGKLPYTLADQATDYNSNLVNSTELVKSTDPDAWQADFVEGQLIDYKEFDAHHKTPAYEFGFGLSYTTFELSGVQVAVQASNPSRLPDPSAPIAPGGNVQLWETLATVKATVKNTGGLAGATVAQLYLSLPGAEAGKDTPVRNLRGFQKVKLAPGASAEVEFPLMRRDLSFWDTAAQAWRLPEGAIGVDVGFSSRDLKLKSEIKI
ncbi:avenacinase [Gaeumannomyces hyphopodioides]